MQDSFPRFLGKFDKVHAINTRLSWSAWVQAKQHIMVTGGTARSGVNVGALKTVRYEDCL